MKIGIVMQSPDMGGAEEYMLLLISEFLKKGNDVYVASNRGKFYDKARQKSLRMYTIPKIMDINGNLRGLIKTTIFLPYFLYFYLTLLFNFKKEKIDVILMSNFTEKLFVSLLSIFFRIPVVWIEYGSLAPVFKRNFYIPKIIYRVLKIIPKKIIVPSKNTWKSLIEDARVAQPKLVIIPCAIKKIKSIKYPKPRRLKNKLIIGSVSRLTKEKGQEYFIKAVPKVIEKIPNAYFLIIGDGPDKKNFVSLVNRLKIRKYVELPGFVSNKDLYYSYMDLFVFPTVWNMEGFGLVNLEAMSHKLPIIASDIGPTKEIILQDKTGLLIKPGNSEDLSKAIINLARNKQKRISLGNNGYKRFIDKYTIDKSAAQILKILYDSTN